MSESMDVLFIAGAGRSGSTLLELILGNRPGFFSVGEVRFFWEYWQQQNRLCGCGELLTTCYFWTGVHERLKAVGVDVNQIAALASRYDRTRNLMSIAWKNGRFFPNHLVTATSHLYRAIHAESTADAIVDSSKVPSHLYLLKQIPNLNLHVLHLVRDGRAVAYSWGKRRKRESGSLHQQTMPGKSLSKAIVVWMIENQFVQLASTQAVHYARLRYEDFVHDPAGQLEQALAALGWTTVDLTHLKESSFSVWPTHSVGGNPLRFAQQVELQIRADNVWREKMPVWQRWGLGLLALPTLRQHGYSL